MGYQAGYSNTTGDLNTAIGRLALYTNSTGTSNSALGSGAMSNNTTGGYNVGIGRDALASNTTATDNTAVGYKAGYGVTTGYINTLLGSNAGSTITTGVNNTCIGHNSQASSASVYNEITLGDVYVNNLRCNDTTISSLSDVRDKTNIEAIPFGLDYICAMRPVKFDWDRRDGSANGRKDFGFIAQELDVVEQTFGLSEYTRLVHKDNLDKWEADPMKTYPILIKAIQELKAELDTVKAELATLKGN